MAKAKVFLERLAAGETLVVAEGYLFEFEARGYLKAGHYVPEVVLEHPELVKQMHEEFVHAGSDVVLAFTYYANREKMNFIGREDDLEKMNRTALKIAREVADKTGTLMAGNICNSNTYKEDDPENLKKFYNSCVEQVKWAVEGGADFIVAETFSYLPEAITALKAIKEHGQGLPAVVTFALPATGKVWTGESAVQCCKMLEEAGAAVVGLNCARGPATMLPILKEIRNACSIPIAALPVVYRTNEDNPCFQSLYNVDRPESTAFPEELGAWMCTREQIANFAKEAKGLGVQYLGLCCGNRAHYLRAMAEAVGKTPPASRFSPDMTTHYSRSKDERSAVHRKNFLSNYKDN